MRKDIAKKEELLKKSGFHFNHNRRFWYNRALRKIFSKIYIQDDDHDEECLIKNIGETKQYFGEWQWYCNKEPSEEEKKTFLS